MTHLNLQGKIRVARQRNSSLVSQAILLAGPRGPATSWGEQFIQDLYASWAEKGAETIEAVRIERPHEYVKVVASILPKELNVNHTGLDDMTDDQLIKKLRALTAMARPLMEGLDDSKPDAGTARSTH
jgi:hypothetical protein